MQAPFYLWGSMTPQFAKEWRHWCSCEVGPNWLVPSPVQPGGKANKRCMSLRNERPPLEKGESRNIYPVTRLA